jgi:hypothetical protein
VRRVLLAILAFAALPCASAQASNITVVHHEPIPCTSGDECRYYMPEPPYDNFTLSGAPGESNRITVSGTGAYVGPIRFRDDGAPIGDIPAGCARVNASEVTCSGRLGYANGGDGNDVISTHGANTYGLGGAGDDELIGSDIGDSLDGGPGNDILRGNGGLDYLTDGEPGAVNDADTFLGGAGGARVSYLNATAPVTVDLADTGPVQGEAGEGDRFADVIDVEGGMGNDDLTAAEGGSKLMGGPGDDKLTGRAGNDELDGSFGKNVIDGGAGRDAIGPGFPVPSQNQVTCGTDADVVTSPNAKDLIAGDCELVVFYGDTAVTSFLPLASLSRPVVRVSEFSCYERGRPNLELRVARLYRTSGMPRAGTLLGRRTATRRACRPRPLAVRLSSTGQRLLRRHKRLPVEVRVNDPGNKARYITELVAP